MNFLQVVVLDNVSFWRAFAFLASYLEVYVFFVIWHVKVAAMDNVLKIE